MLPRQSIDVDALVPSDRVSRMINSSHYVSPSKPIYSDRFIPSRSTSKFSLFHLPPATHSQTAVAAGGGGGKEEGGSFSSSAAYAAVLRAALFGPGTHDNRDNGNIFRYKSETRMSLSSLSTFGFEESGPGGVCHTPVKAPRKVPESPYKVGTCITYYIGVILMLKDSIFFYLG